MMNRQEIFNKVAQHLLEQNEQATLDTEGHACRLLDDNNRKCAVGCLIPDDKYFMALEKLGSMGDHFTPDDSIFRDDTEDMLTSILKDEGIEFNEANYRLLMALQNIHDDVSVFDWEEELKKCADSFGLSDEVIACTRRKYLIRSS